MNTAAESEASSKVPPKGAGSVFPTTPGEVTTVLVHYYRAEIGRMAGWRDRIDRTTNWAITVVAAMLSISLSTPDSHHGVLLFGMLVVFLLLMIEARRYRFFDVYRWRVRRLERSYFAQVLAPAAAADTGWTRALGEDLRQPLFLISLGRAMSRRLRRNYIWIFLILLLAWAVKITTPSLQTDASDREFVDSLRETLDYAALGVVPGWLVIGAVAGLHGFLLYAALRPEKDARDIDGNVHV